MKRIRLTESQLHNVIKESVRKILRENNGDTEMNAPYSEWEKFLGGKEPLFEFYNSETDDYDNIYVDYDEESGMLDSGYVTNIGFHKDGTASVEVFDGDFQSAMEEIYDKISNNEYQKGFDVI